MQYLRINHIMYMILIYKFINHVSMCYIIRVENMRFYCNIMHTKNKLMKNKEKNVESTISCIKCTEK